MKILCILRLHRWFYLDPIERQCRQCGRHELYVGRGWHRVAEKTWSSETTEGIK